MIVDVKNFSNDILTCLILPLAMPVFASYVLAFTKFFYLPNKLSIYLMNSHSFFLVMSLVLISNLFNINIATLAFLCLIFAYMPFTFLFYSTYLCLYKWAFISGPHIDKTSFYKWSDSISFNCSIYSIFI